MTNRIVPHQIKQLVIPLKVSLLLSLFATLLSFAFFYSVGLTHLLPFIPSLLLASFMAILVAIIFKKALIQPYIRKKTFLLGSGIFLFCLPFYDLGAIYFIQEQFDGMTGYQHTIQELGQLYLVTLVYSLIFIGSWVSILCGFFLSWLKRQGLFLY